jgi:tetratricopeptide (TPR) repeat protein
MRALNPPVVSRSFRAVLGLALLLGLTGEASADYLKYYWDGREAYRQEKYRESVIFLDRAIKEQPKAGERVRWRGTHFETYLPHFHLARALYHLRLFDQALEVWKESVRQGEILKRGNRRQYKELQKLLELIRSEHFPEEVERIRDDVGSTAEHLQALRKRGIGGLAIEEPALEDVASLLESARRDLSAAQAQHEFAPLGQASETIAKARTRLLAVLDELEQRQKQREREAEEKRLARAAASFERAVELLAVGECSTEAIDLLQEVLQGGLLPAETRSGGSSVFDLLSRAHARCGDPLGTAHYTELARYCRQGAGEESDEQGSLVRDLLACDSPADAPGTESGQGSTERVLSDSVAARAAIDLRECNPMAIATLRAALPALELLSGGPEDLAVEPHLDLARAYRACGDREQTEKYVALARAEREASPDDVKRLGDWLRRTEVLGIYTKSHALIVGVANYRAASWGMLPEVLEDVNEVERLLHTHGFVVDKLVDPTSEDLNEAMKSFFGRKRRRESRLVFYYGGHGHTETNDFIRLGYIVPSDTPYPKEDSSGGYLNYLVSMDGFEGFAKSTGSNHAMFLFDSCFSGSVFDATSTRFRMSRRSSVALEETLSRPARLFVTAGDETQMVPAESVFRAAVVRALEGFADADTDGLILGAEIGKFVARHGASSRNTPQWGMLEVGGFDTGDLAFQVPDPESYSVATPTVSQSLRTALAVEIVLWRLVRDSDRRDAVRKYVERYPDGHFVPLAEWILERRSATRPDRDSAFSGTARILPSGSIVPPYIRGRRSVSR